MGLFQRGISSQKTLLLYVALCQVLSWWSPGGCKSGCVKRLLLKRGYSYLMSARTQTYETSATIGLIERSHAPELTLNLTGFPFLNGTCSP